MAEVPWGWLAGSWVTGLALSLFGAATVHRFQEVLHPGASLTPVALLAMLVGLAMGMSIPNRYARRFSKLVGRWDGRARREPNSAWESGDVVEVTATQLQVICAAGLVISGLSIMAAHLLAPPLARLYVAALESFHWTSLTSHVLDFVLLFSYVLMPCGLLGIVLNCTQRATPLYTPRVVLPTGCLSLGLSCGLLTPGLFGGLPPTGTESVAALLLLLSGIASASAVTAGRCVRQPEQQTPGFCDRWRFVLVGVLYAAGFLSAYYVLTWQKLFLAAGLAHGAAAPLGALSLGVLLSTSIRIRSWNSMRSIAVACMLASALIAVIVVCVGLAFSVSPFSECGSVLGRGEWRWMWVPAVLMGLVVGLVTFAVVERSAHLTGGLVSCSIAMFLAAAAACVASVPEFVNESKAFHLLVVMALAWLMTGGLVLIYEPGFGLLRCRSQAVLMIGVLGLLTLVLPAQAPRWSVMLRGLARAATGSLMTVSHTGLAKLPDDAFLSWAAEPMSLEAMLRELQTTREKYAGIVITWPAMRGDQASEMMRAALARAAAAKLRPDGILLTRFKSEEAPRGVAGLQSVP